MEKKKSNLEETAINIIKAKGIDINGFSRIVELTCNTLSKSEQMICATLKPHFKIPRELEYEIEVEFFQKTGLEILFEIQIKRLHKGASN